MRNKTDPGRTTKVEVPCNSHEEAVLEFLFNDEEEALCNDDYLLIHQRQMPAIREFLEEMSELDSCSSLVRLH